MQFKSLAFFALSAGAIAAPEEKRQATDANVASIIQVLQTAVPTSLALEFLTNSAGVYSSVASELAVGSTPSWIAALPSDVQSYLTGVAENPSAASSAIANITSGGAGAIITSPPTVNATGIAGNITSSLIATLNSANSSLSSAIVAGNGTALVSNGTAIANNGTALATGLSSSTRTGSSGASTVTATRSGSGSGSAAGSSGSAGSGSAGSSGTSTGGASLPTAIGMGLAGAVGLVGVFVL